MRFLRLSVSTLVVSVLIAAFDLAMLRYFPGHRDWNWHKLFALPMANILMFAFYHDRKRRRRCERSPFLFGFQLLGWSAVLTYLGWCRMYPQETDLAFAHASEWVHVVSLENLDFDTMKSLDPTFVLAWRIAKAAQLAAVAAVLNAIMLLLAFWGGIIVRQRYRAAGDVVTTA